METSEVSATPTFPWLKALKVQALLLKRWQRRRDMQAQLKKYKHTIKYILLLLDWKVNYKSLPD